MQEVLSDQYTSGPAFEDLGQREATTPRRALLLDSRRPRTKDNRGSAKTSHTLHHNNHATQRT